MKSNSSSWRCASQHGGCAP